MRAQPMAFNGPKLVVTAGPKAGEEFGLEESEYVVGRATDNAICIQDTSVSRKHIMLRKVGSGWTVTDLGSGNGTLVNGEQITDETVLGNGDVITMGDTEVTFSDVANSTMMVAITPGPTRPRSSTSNQIPARPGRPERVRPGRGAKKEVDPASQRKKKALVAMVGLVVVLAGSGLVILQMRQQAIIAAEKAKAELLAKERARLAAIFQDAKNLIREGKWAEAKVQLEDLQKQAPDMGGLKDYLERVEKEIPNQEHVNAAQAALADKKLAVAKAELEKIGSDTTMFELVNKLKRQLKDASDAQVKEARALLDNKQLDQAKAITEDVLAIFPEDRDAKIINEEADRLIKVRDTPVAPPPPPPTAPPWEQAAARFVDGDVSGAAALANACISKPKCKSMLKDMTEFGNLYKKLEDLDAKGLARLLSLDKDISGARGPSKMAKNAGTRAANIFYKSASAARAAGQYPRAVEYARRTLQADPGHAGATNILNELKSKAKEIYFQAYAQQASNPEEALQQFKEVLSMTPPDDEWHQKAQNRIDALSK